MDEQKTFKNGQKNAIPHRPQGRVCASPNCNHGGIVQPWENFAKKGHRHTSRCKVCIANDRANVKRKNELANKAKKRRIAKVEDVELKNDVLNTDASDAASGNVSDVLGQLALDSFVGIDEGY